MKRPVTLALLVSALLMLASLDHGLPQRYVPDDTVVRCALGIAADLSTAEGGLGGKLAALVPPAGAYTTYPYLLPYLDLGALSATYVVGRVLGTWGGAGAFREAVFENPGVAWLPARFVTVLLALLLPWAAARAARELGRPGGEAALAALVAGTSLLVVQYAHTTRPWAPMVGLGAASLAWGLALRRTLRLREAALSFACAGLAGATLQVGLLFLAVPVTAVFCAWRHARAERPGEGARVLRHGAVALAVGLVLLVGLGWPHVLLHGADTGAGAIADAGDEVSLELGGQAFKADIFAGRLLLPTLSAWLLYDPVLVLLGFGGLLLWWRSGPRLPVTLLVIAPALLFTLLFLLYDGTHVRYLMPATPFLALGAARVLSALSARGGLLRVLAVLLVALPIVQAARLDWLLAQDDTRTRAAAVLPDLVGPGAVLAVDGMGSYYGPPLLPTAESLLRVASTGVWLNRQEQRVLQLADAGVAEPGHARHLVPVQRYWVYDSFYPTDYVQAPAGGPAAPYELGAFMDAWDVDFHVQVDRVPDEARRQPVTDLHAARSELVWELSPTGRSAPREAALPTDMSAALVDLWTYERPGPWIRLWRLRPDGAR